MILCFKDFDCNDNDYCIIDMCNIVVGDLFGIDVVKFVEICVYIMK